MRRFLITLFILLSFFRIPLALAEPGNAAALIESAARARLWENPQWLALLHMRTSALESEIDDPSFFLAPSGKHDARAELEATLSAFFEERTEDEAAQCRFRARYLWLKDALRFDAATLKERACPKFEAWRAAINPHGATLVFPTAFLNNPASTFGHTLIRIDSPGRTDEQSLPDYTAGYAAETHGENALLYALRGSLGGYFGFFSVAPYYEKVKKYSDLENRDIWEYALTLTPAEVDRMVQHLWELRRIRLFYYYFDENCSYELLSLLDVARPSLALARQFDAWVIPVDTVRAITNTPGLVASKKFRPSAATILLRRMRGMSGAAAEQAKAIALGSVPPGAVAGLPPVEQAGRLEVAYDYLTYLRIKKHDDDPALKERSFALLGARSKVAARPEDFPTATPVSPDEGHRTEKLALSGGILAGEPFYQFEWRPAHHDLLDPGAGFTAGAEIKFFDLVLRQERSRKLELQRLTLLEINSITPRSEILRPWSWHVLAEAGRERWSADDRPLVGHGALAFGRALDLGSGAAAYMIAGPAAAINRQYDDRYALGLGPLAGVTTNTAKALAAGIDGGWERFALGDVFTRYHFGATLRYSFTRNLAARAQVERRQEFDTPATEALLSLEWFR